MAAYVIVDLEIVDPAGFDKYRKRIVPIVENYGGKYIVVSDRVETLEGDWKPERIVVIEFPSMEQAKEWFNCEEYREPSEIRHRTAKTNMILVEGM
jgi:uncharacterized protein (DUF1330 family)